MLRFLLAASLAAAFCLAAPCMGNAAPRAMVVYFSATGTTKAAAEKLASAIGADLKEIVPAQPYTAADLDWHNKQSRSSVEMKDPSARPALAGTIDLSGYDVVFVGYPIWWAVAPRIINTFLDSADIKGRKLVPFCTSGGSGLGKSGDELEDAYPAAKWKPGRQIDRSDTKEQLAGWAGNYLK